MTSTLTPPRTGRVYAGHRSPMSVHHWQELGRDPARATELATYGHQARDVVVLNGQAVYPPYAITFSGGVRMRDGGSLLPSSNTRRPSGARRCSTTGSDGRGPPAQLGLSVKTR